MKRLQYITRRLKSNNTQFCRVTKFDRAQVREAFEHRINKNEKSIQQYWRDRPKSVHIPIQGSHIDYIEFGLLGLESEYIPENIDWTTLWTGFEYFFLANQLMLTEPRLRLRLDRTKFLNPLCAAILADRTDMILFYKKWIDKIKPRKDDNLDLIAFIDCVLAGKTANGCGVFSFDAGDDFKAKFEALLVDHHKNTLFENTRRPYYMPPYNTFPVHIFLWLKYHQFKDPYNLYKFAPEFENIDFQHNDFIKKIIEKRADRLV